MFRRILAIAMLLLLHFGCEAAFGAESHFSLPGDGNLLKTDGAGPCDETKPLLKKGPFSCPSSFLPRIPDQRWRNFTHYNTDLEEGESGPIIIDVTGRPLLAN